MKKTPFDMLVTFCTHTHARARARARAWAGDAYGIGNSRIIDGFLHRYETSNSNSLRFKIFSAVPISWHHRTWIQFIITVDVWPNYIVIRSEIKVDSKYKGYLPRFGVF